MTNHHQDSFRPKINLNYTPLSKLSMDLKVMPRSHKGHKPILSIIDEVTNYLITVPIHQARLEEVGENSYRKYYNKVLCSRVYIHGSR